jgi:hypothetical protein
VLIIVAKKKPSKPRIPDDVPVQTDAPPLTPAGDDRLPLIVGVTVATIALVAVAAWLPDLRLWGINHLAFLPPAIRIALLALLAVALLPPVAVAAYSAALKAADAAGNAPRTSGRLITVAAMAVASIGVFYAFHSATNLLGDGQLILQSFEAAEEGHELVIMRSAGAIVTEEKIAPGATLLYYGAIKFLKPFGRTPEDAMRIFNCILGGLFVFFTLWAASSRGLDRDSRVWVTVLGLFSTSIVLFFGYIENYTAACFFLLLYVIVAFRAIHRQCSPWLAIVPLAVAIYAHVQCILFLPSLLYLLLWTKRRRQRAWLVSRWIPFFAIAAVAGIVGITLYPPIRAFYVPLGVSNQAYALFSPDHLLDIVNELLMILPILPIVVALAWVGRRAQRAGGRDPIRDSAATKDPSAWFTHPVEWQFAATALIPCLLYLVLFNTAIGMARDWDLFAMTVTAVVPLVLLALNRWRLQCGVSPERTAAFAVPTLVAVMVLGGSWIAVNASTDRTVERFTRILTYDQTHASYAWENLAILQHDSGQLQEAIATMERAVEVSHNPRQIVRLAVYVEEDGRTDEAIAMLEKVLERRPEFSKARFRLVLFLEKKQDWGRMLVAARDGVKHSPGEPIYHFFYGESLLRAGQTAEAMEIFRACQKMNLPKAALDYMASTLARYDQEQQPR